MKHPAYVNDRVRKVREDISSFLYGRYGYRKGLTMLEIGGKNFTIISDSIPLRDNLLVEMDNCEKNLKNNRELTSSKPNIGYVLATAPTGTIPDKWSGKLRRNREDFEVPFRDSVFDVAFLFHFPMYSRPREEIGCVFSGLHRVLKSGGELVVYPVRDDYKSFGDLFDTVFDEPYLLVLRKKPFTYLPFL